MSHDASTVSARFIYGSTTTHDDSATIHHGGATNAHDASTIRYDASTIQSGSATVASRPPTNLHDLVVVMRQSQGGGGTLIFSSYVGSSPASTVHPKNIRNFNHPQKIFEIFSNPQKYPPFCNLILKKTPKYIEIIPKYSPIL